MFSAESVSQDTCFMEIFLQTLQCSECCRTVQQCSEDWVVVVVGLGEVGWVEVVVGHGEVGWVEDAAVEAGPGEAELVAV